VIYSLAGLPAGLTRSARGRERLEPLRVHAVETDVFDEVSLLRAFDACRPPWTRVPGGIGWAIIGLGG
jgi:hypothetical protein